MDAGAILIFAIKASIMLTVLSLGLNATWADATSLFRRPGMLLRSVLSMNIIMPLVAAALVVGFNLPQAMKIALVALSLSPVPPILPKKELKAGGNASYAVGLLVAIGMLAIVTVPIGVSWFSSAFDRNGAVSPLTVAKVVFTSVLLPLGAGILLRRLVPELARKAIRPVAVVGMILLVASSAPLLYATWPAVTALFGNGTVAIVAGMAVIGLVVGHLLGGPNADERTVLALSTSSRHPAVALATAVAAGAESKPQLAAILLYVILSLLISIPYVWWRRRATNAPGDRTGAL